LSEVDQGAALARIDLLPDEVPAPAPKEATVEVPGRGEVTARIIGPVLVADTQLQGPGFLVLIPGGRLPAGAYFRGRLPGSGETAHGLTVPRNAVVYHQGSAWVYVFGEEDTFERRLVTLGRAMGRDRVVVATGIEADDQIAVTGAQQLLAAELQAGGAGEEP
jgi:hypothetical protein